MKFITKIINADIIVCTAFVFSLIWALSQIEINLDFVDPIGKALESFQVTDLVYTALRDEPKPDTNITMVNIGNLDRGGIATLINNINEHSPAVIGIDARFFKDKTEYYRQNGLPNADSLLEIAFSNTKNLVLATKLDNVDTATGQWTMMNAALPRFRQHAYDGFVNVITKEEDFRIARKVTPVEFVNDTVQTFFPVKITELYDKSKVDKFMARDKVQKFIALKKAKENTDVSANFLETIYFRGNINNFFGETDEFGRANAFNVIDAEQALNAEFDPSLVKGKICILGYMGETVRNNKYWDEDKFYTPLNKNFAGKSFPDMYGVVVHANIVSMLLNETYVDVVDPDKILIINIIICILNVILFAYVHHYIHVWWDGLSVVITLAEALLLLAVQLICFEYYRIEIEFGYAIAFIFLLGNLLELYYEYAKPGLLWTYRKLIPVKA